MVNRLIALIAIILGCAFSAPKKSDAQWKATLWPDGNHPLYLEKMVSFGSTCVAGGVEGFDTLPYYRFIFVKSTDEGRTWRKIYPSFPTRSAYAFRYRAMCMPDSLHVFAAADSGFIVKSTDAGESWTTLPFPTNAEVEDIDFLDSNVGVAVAFARTDAVLITTNGGLDWTPSKASIAFPVACNALDVKSYEILGSLNGPMYYSSDTCATFDSTSVLFDVAKENSAGRHIAITAARFAGADTVIASGVWATDSTPMRTILYRTTDRGRTWKELTDVPLTGHAIRSMTSIRSDTVYASSPSFNNLMISTNRGASWRLDTVIMKQTYPFVAAPGLLRFADGAIVAVFQQTDALFYNGRIYRWDPPASSVESYERIIYGTKIYPNPASEIFHIESNDPGQDISVEDILGRELLRQHIGADGKATFNSSNLPRGVYQLRIHHDGKLLPVGRVVLN